MPKVPDQGGYQVLMAYSAHETRAQQVPVTISNGSSETKITVDQTRPLPVGEYFRSIGMFALTAGVETVIRINNTDTTGIVIAYTLQLVRMK